jgi:NAD(P)H dehydrogenase (quinone)
MTKIDKIKPIVLVLGSTGQVGKLIVETLSHIKEVRVRVTSRKPEEVEALRNQGQDAVYLDLDDPCTFAGALAGVDRLFFLLTGYTVAMLVQSKTPIDTGRVKPDIGIVLPLLAAQKAHEIMDSGHHPRGKMVLQVI